MNLLRQIAVLLAICVAGNALAALTGGLLPGNVIGLVLLLVLLLTRRLRLEAVESTADFLLNNMALLFLPATVGILKVYGNIRSEIGKLVLICAVTTVLTALSAGGAVLLVRRIQNGRENRK